jgi:hypothetical protein
MKRVAYAEYRIASASCRYRPALSRDQSQHAVAIASDPTKTQSHGQWAEAFF